VSYHPETRQLLDLIAEPDARPFTELTPEAARRVPASLMEMVGAGPEVAVVRDIEIPGPAGPIPARVYEPAPEPTGSIARYDDQIHAFFSLVNLLESADRAVAEAGAATREAVSA
jgi:hypothetical protein